MLAWLVTSSVRFRLLVLPIAAALLILAAPPQMLKPLSSTSRVLMIGLQRKNPKKISPIDLSIIARWIIRPRLLGLQGVANVTIYGQRDRQLQVLVDPQRLKSRG